MFETEKRFSQEVSHCVWQWMLIRLTVATVSQWIGASAVAACGHVPRQDVWPAADRPRARRWSHRVTTGPEHFHRPVTSEPRNVTTPSAASAGCGWGRRGGPPGAGFCGANQRGRLELQQGGMAEDGAREKDHGRTRTPGSARRRAGRGPPPNSTRSFECSRTWTHHQAVLIDRDIRDVLSAHEPSEGAKTSGQATFLKRVAPSQEEPPAVREVFRKKPPSSQETRPHACRFP